MADFQDTLALFSGQPVYEYVRNAVTVQHSSRVGKVVANHVFHALERLQSVRMILHYWSFAATFLLLIAVGTQCAHHVKSLQAQIERWAKLNLMSKRCLISESRKREQACSVYDEFYCMLINLHNQLSFLGQQSPFILESTYLAFDSELLDLIAAAAGHKQTFHQICGKLKLGNGILSKAAEAANISNKASQELDFATSVFDWLEAVRPINLESEALERLSKKTPIFECFREN